jgi:hypothetical protein
VQRVFHGTSVLCKRRCRVSYGVLCSERYNKNLHRDQTPIKSPLDGKYYVTNQIDWFIRKGELVTEDIPITRQCSRVIGCGSPERGWCDTVVMSRLPSDCLPHVLGRGDTREVRTIVTDLGPAVLNAETPGVEMKRRWGVLGKKFLRAEYELLVFIEGESLKFRTRVDGEEKSESEAVSAPWVFSQDAEELDGFQGGLLRN